jgi:hypothetical protein
MTVHETSAGSRIFDTSEFARLLVRIDAHPETTTTWLELGLLLYRQLRLREAAEVLRRVVERNPDSVGALYALGCSYLALAEPLAASRCLKAVVAHNPQHWLAHHSLGEALFLSGDPEAGWNAFEQCYRCRTIPLRRFAQPLWDGTPLEGKTILLWSDQGRGDTIQFLRYVEFAHAAGGNVIIECHFAELIDLIAQMPHVDRVVLRGSSLPSFDTHAPLMFFPALVRSCRSGFTARFPYVSVPQELVETWRQRIRRDSAKTVGLVWGSNPLTRHAMFKSLSLVDLAPILQMTSIRFISLQHGPQAAELEGSALGLRVENVSPGEISLMDYAAQIICMDLVITVDTMAAHLTGALGQPVWTLVMHPSNWRWPLDSEHTSWYPTMRLFRQPVLGDWSSVIERVRTALREEFPIDS